MLQNIVPNKWQVYRQLCTLRRVRDILGGMLETDGSSFTEEEEKVSLIDLSIAEAKLNEWLTLSTTTNLSIVDHVEAFHHQASAIWRSFN